MTTTTEDSDFINSVVHGGLLEDSIDWIKNNLNPESVFSESDLDTWALENGYIKGE